MLKFEFDRDKPREKDVCRESTKNQLTSNIQALMSAPILAE